LAAEEVERMVTQLNQEIEQLLSEVEGAASAE
jgi:type III secretory pathway lipoprotein EscJ